MNSSIVFLVIGVLLILSSLDKRQSFRDLTLYLGLTMALIVAPAIFCTQIFGAGAWGPIVMGGVGMVAGLGLIWGMLKPMFSTSGDTRGWADVTVLSDRNLEYSAMVWLIGIATFAFGGFFWGWELQSAYHASIAMAPKAVLNTAERKRHRGGADAQKPLAQRPLPVPHDR